MLYNTMQVIAHRAIRQFWEAHRQAEAPLRAWYAVMTKATLNGPADLKRLFGARVDIVADNRAIFDIGGNKFRLVVRISYEFKRVLVKFVGTHKEYDKIDAVLIGKPAKKGKK